MGENLPKGHVNYGEIAKREENIGIDQHVVSTPETYNNGNHE